MKIRDIFKKAKSAKSRNKSYTTDSTQEVKVKRAFNMHSDYYDIYSFSSFFFKSDFLYFWELTH